MTLALLTVAAPARAQAPQNASLAGVAKEEPRIVAIRIVKEDGQVLTNSPSGLPVEAGKALDRGKIADSLRALYRLGDYADLRAVVTPEADGVRLDFVVRENLFFNEVRIEGLLAQVELTVTEPARVVAVVTRDAVEELGLKPGMAATAVVKSTSVMVEA